MSRAPTGAPARHELFDSAAVAYRFSAVQYGDDGAPAMDSLTHLFASTPFMPHGHCFLWTPLLIWAYVLSDASIALAYYSIPVALWWFARRRSDLPFSRLRKARC